MAVAVAAADPTPLVDGLPGVGDLAVTPNGQTVAFVDPRRRVIVALDPRAPDARRDIVVAAGDDPVPEAIAFIDTTVLAAVCRQGDAWTLRCWRLLPDRPASVPLQTIAIGSAAADPAAPPRLVVSRDRDWLAIAGLPEPLQPILRAAVAGIRVGPLTSRLCPRLPAGSRPVTATVSPADELVVVTRSRPHDRLGFYDPQGRCLLELDAGLDGIRTVAFSPDGDGLWAVGGDSAAADRPDGLWRLDGLLRDGRQAIRAVPMASVPGGQGLVCPTGRRVIIAAPAAGRIVQFEPEDLP